MVLTGLQAVLVTAQLLAHLMVDNLVSRTDEPPWWLVWPLRSPLGKIIFCCDVPLLGMVGTYLCYSALEATLN